MSANSSGSPQPADTNNMRPIPSRQFSEEEEIHVNWLIDQYVLSQGIRLPILPNSRRPSNPEEYPFWEAVTAERRRRYTIARRSRYLQGQRALLGAGLVQAASAMAPQMSRTTIGNQNSVGVGGAQAMGAAHLPAGGMTPTQSASPSMNPNLPAPNQQAPTSTRPPLAASGSATSISQTTLPGQYPTGAYGIQTAAGVARFPASGATAPMQNVGPASFGHPNLHAPTQEAATSAHHAQASSSMAAPQPLHLPDSTTNGPSRQPQQALPHTLETHSTAPAAVVEENAEAKKENGEQDGRTQGTKRPASEPFTDQESKRPDGPLPKRNKQDQEATHFPVFFLVKDLKVRSYDLMAVSPEKEAAVNSVLLWIRKVEQAKYAKFFKSWCNGKRGSCLCHYVFHRFGAKDMAWRDDVPHKVACWGCPKRQEPCVILDVDDQNELIFVVLPQPAPSDSTASVWL
ncbi:hypothetical protein IWZ01DRAFT_561031 [Phyllosticta capitalensis]